MHSITPRSLVLLLALIALPTFAWGADLVSVTTSVSHPTAYPSGANEGTVLINNNHTADVRVRLNVRVIYSNGTVQRLSGIADPGVLPPGGGFFLSVYFVIPPDAPLGPARFVADVSASASGLTEQESSSAAFEVIAP